jgi:hypothetical protein
MSVHIGEVHTDVTVGAAASATDTDRARERDSRAEIAAAAHRRAAWLERRVRADDFDD